MTPFLEEAMERENVICALKVENRAVRKDLDGFISSLPGFTVEKSDSCARCDLLVIEVNGHAEQQLDFARDALTSHVTKNIFFTSPDADPGILIQALKIGVKGFFRQPVDFNEVRETLMGIREEKRRAGDEQPIRKGKIIYTLGSKGGVGTSTVAANLAMSLAATEGPGAVVFLDVNEVFGDAPLFFNIERPVDWMDVSRNMSRLDATYLMTILFKHESGLYVLPAPAMATDASGMGKVMQELLHLMQSLFRYVVVDGGRRLDEVSRSIIKMSDRVLVITQMTLSSVINANRLQKLFQEWGYTNTIDIVVNRFTKKDAAFQKDAEKVLGRELEWRIPNDYRTAMAAINEGKPMTAVDRKADVSLRIRDLAMAVAGRCEEKPSKKSFLGFTG
jgi:pilus assembly protein CpaE